MTRRTNLNTLRTTELNGRWTSYQSSSYTSNVLSDLSIQDYLVGLFYVLRMPTSYYVIRRFHSDIVLVDVDVLVFNFTRLKKCQYPERLFYFVMFRFRR